MKNPLRRNGIWFTERYEVVEHGVAGTATFLDKFRNREQAEQVCREEANPFDVHEVRDRWETP